MKLTEVLITTLLKHGAFGELKNFKTEVFIPGAEKDSEPIKIIISADALKVSMDKGD